MTSDPEGEYIETVNKPKAIRRAAEEVWLVCEKGN